MNKKVITFIVVSLLIIFIFFVFKSKNNQSKETNDVEVNTGIEINNNVNNEVENTSIASDNENNDLFSYINSIEDIELHAVDNLAKEYKFKYRDEIYTAIYTADNWHINDSYKITDEHDIEIICEALLENHKIHGKDMISYRTAEDMTYEWLQHNLAYNVLPEDNEWKKNAKDVDLDPADQGRSLLDMYEARNKK